MSLQKTIDDGIKAAMLAKDETRLRSLRAVKAALLVARTEKGASEEMTEDAELKVLQKLVKQRKESADIYQAQQRADLYQIEADEMAIISSFLPQQMSREQIEAAVDNIIKETNSTSIKDMGKVMGLANKILAGKADGKTISEVVKSKLN